MSDSGDGIDIATEERAAIDHYHQLRQDATHYELLGVSAGADRKAIRDAYFALSKRFHPDVYFKREIGPYRERIEGVFRALTRAYDALSNPRQRAAYDKLLADEGVAPVSPTIAPPPPPKASPPSGVRPPQQQAERGSATSSASPAGTPKVNLPEGAVVPPSLRTLVEATGVRQPTPATSTTPPVVDESVRQRALEAMARRLGVAGKRPATASSTGNATGSSPPGQTAQQLLEERRARVAALVAKAEESQKAGNLQDALEGYKAALQLQKDDAGIAARIDAVSQLLRVAAVNDHIEKAKAAARDRQMERAAMHWEKAWENRREDPTLLLNAAEILAKAGEHKRAAELAQRAITVDPKLAKAHAILAQVFLDAGLKASAKGAIENLARLEPANPQLEELRKKLGPTTLAEQFGLRGSR